MGIKKISFRLLMASIILAALVLGCQKQQNTAVSAKKKRELANVFYNQQLFSQAVAEYRDYLDHYPLKPREQANISYQIANIYFDRIHDYENALAYYLRIKYLYPESSLQKEVAKKIVACLERLQRSTDAQQAMAQTSALDENEKPKTRPGEVVAKIGNRNITTGDLQYEINRLPAYLKPEMEKRENKIKFLKQYIAQELLYDSAKRQGLDKNRDVIEGVFQAKKALMVQKLLEKEITKTVKPENYTNADVELYYKANKKKYAVKDKKGKVKRIRPFSEVAQQAAQDFIQEKQQAASQQLIDRLMKAENVKIYEEKFK